VAERLAIPIIRSDGHRGAIHALLLVAAGCGLLPDAPDQQGPSIVVPARPPESDCQEIRKTDLGLAARVRTGFGVRGVEATSDAVMSAASDPTATSDTYGIPLTRSELDELQRAGIGPDPAAILTEWTTGRPEVFGVPYLSDGALTIPVRVSDSDLLRATRCYETGALVGHVVYVSASASSEELDALLAAIIADRGLLQGSGINVTTAWTDRKAGTVVIGVKGLPPTVEAELRARYGPLVRAVEHSGFDQN
jgi:hypothetical protein